LRKAPPQGPTLKNDKRRAVKLRRNPEMRTGKAYALYNMQDTKRPHKEKGPKWEQKKNQRNQGGRNCAAGGRENNAPSFQKGEDQDIQEERAGLIAESACGGS